MSNKRAHRKRPIERASRGYGPMGIQGDFSSYTGGNNVTIPATVLAKMLQSMAPQKNQAQDFAPGAPLRPYQGVVPLGGPRQFSYNTGINLSNNDRSMGKPDIPSFEQLRLFAMLYEGVGLCERVLLDMIPNLVPQVTLRKDMAEGGAKAQDYQPQIKRWRAFLEMPSPGQQLDIHSWIRMAWTEQTQIDALAIFKHKTRGGGLYGLEIIDGASIKPILDERGMVPLANQGFPAWQQYPYGVPGDLYTTDAMLYYRESPRAFTPYGFSRVERIITRVNQALRKEQRDLAKFTEGNLPAGIMEVPEANNWTPDQIDSFEQSWNALMAGNLQQQVRIKFTQPGMKYTEFNDPVTGEKMTEFDVFLLNVATGCYGLSLGDIGFTEDIHKSSGDSQQNMLYRRTLAPLITVYSRILTKVLREAFGDEELEVGFGGYTEAEDIVAQSTAYSGFVSSGILSPAGAARLMNFPEVPETGPLFITKDGPLFLEDIANPEMRKAQQDAQMAGYKSATSAPAPAQDEKKPPQSGNTTPDDEKSAPTSGDTPAEDSTQTISRVNEALTRIDEQLRLIRAVNVTPAESSTDPVMVSQMGVCTCAICRGHHGKRIDFPHEMPPYHTGCDCHMAPKGELSEFQPPENAEAEARSADRIGRGDREVATRSTAESTGESSTPRDDRAKSVSQEYRRWRDKAIKHVTTGSPSFTFVSDVIPRDTFQFITQELQRCSTVDEVKDVFDCLKLVESGDAILCRAIATWDHEFDDWYCAKCRQRFAKQPDTPHMKLKRSREREERPLALASTDHGSSSGGNLHPSRIAWKLRW